MAYCAMVTQVENVWDWEEKIATTHENQKHKTKLFPKDLGLIFQCIFGRNSRLRAVVHTHGVYGHGIQLRNLPDNMKSNTVH